MSLMLCFVCVCRCEPRVVCLAEFDAACSLRVMSYHTYMALFARTLKSDSTTQHFTSSSGLRHPDCWKADGRRKCHPAFQGSDPPNGCIGLCVLSYICFLSLFPLRAGPALLCHSVLCTGICCLSVWVFDFWRPQEELMHTASCCFMIICYI